MKERNRRESKIESVKAMILSVRSIQSSSTSLAERLFAESTVAKVLQILRHQLSMINAQKATQFAIQRPKDRSWMLSTA